VQRHFARSHLSAVSLCLLVLGCVSATPTVYSPAPMRGVRSWDIGFAYESGASAETRDTSGLRETTIVHGGQAIRDLQLRDDVFFILRDKYHVPVTKTGAATDGAIRMVAVHYTFGGFMSLDVRFEDRQGRVLARLQIRNSDRNCCFKNDDKFATYAADKIAELLASIVTK